MQNKKSLLQRMLVIYITFFVVLAAGLAHSLWPNFSRGYNEGAIMGQDIARSLAKGEPRQIFLLGEIPLVHKTAFPVEGLDSLSPVRIIPEVRRVSLTVDRPADPGTGPLRLAFSSVGGSPLFYLLTMLEVVAYIAIVVLMFLIIHSIRRSIREERTLDRRNIWYLRTIGCLTILAELSTSFTAWRMKVRAAELLAGTNLDIDTTFMVSYPTIIMGVIIFFTAEVFAIGQNLSEEQRLTI